LPLSSELFLKVTEAFLAILYGDLGAVECRLQFTDLDFVTLLFLTQEIDFSLAGLKLHFKSLRLGPLIVEELVLPAQLVVGIRDLTL
jgi:hypothetical protein